MTQLFHFWEYIQRKQKHSPENAFVPIMFIAALFTIAKTGKQVSIDGRMDKGVVLNMHICAQSLSRV